MIKNRFLPLDLQFFADGGDNGDQAPNNEPGGQQQLNNTNNQSQNKTGTGNQQTPEENLFRQEDVNNIVAREAKKAQEKLLKELGIDDFDNAKDGLAKFREWQESQKTEQEKQQERMKNLTKENETLSSENANLKAQISAMKIGVKADSVEDVIALADRLVDDETSIDDAIKQVIEKYPHFAEQKEEKQDGPTIVVGGNPNGGNNTPNNNPFAAKLAKYKK